MTVALNALTILFVSVGCFFVTVGTLGLLRLPDTLTRLHALTKADNLGLGLVAIGVALQANSLASALLSILVWILALGAAATISALLSGPPRAAGRSDVSADRPDR